MKILHAIDTTGSGGAETIFCSLAQRFNRSPFESVAAIPGPGWLQDELNRMSIATFCVRSDSGFRMRYLAGLISLIRREQIDLIHSHLLGSNLYCSIAGSLTNKPVIATFHGITDTNLSRSTTKIKVRLTEIMSNGIVAVSQSLARQIVVNFGVNEDRINCIGNGVDLKVFRAQGNRESQEKGGDVHYEVVIGALGNVRNAKGYDVLVQAASLLKSRGLNFRLLIAGDNTNNLAASLVNLVEKLGLEQQITFLGYQDDVPCFLNSLDVFVLSSVSEGFSLATVQALCCGLPVVATRCGGPEEILRGSQAGSLVPVNDPTAMADALEALISNADFRAKLSKRATEFARDQYDIELMFNSYKDLYLSTKY